MCSLETWHEGEKNIYTKKIQFLEAKNWSLGK
jgi:hypothetical protein